MNIFKRELTANLKSLIIWAVITILFVIVGVSKFSAYYNNPDMLSLLNSLPKAVVDALNLQAFNLTTISGFFGIMFFYFALLLGVAASIWGSDIICKEERDKTVEFSLTLPVTRSRMVTFKTLAALTNCVILLLVTMGTSLAVAAQYAPDADFYRFAALCTGALFVLQLIFLSIGILLGSAMKRYKLATSTAVFILLATFFISVLTSLKHDLSFLKYFTPFQYFDPVRLLNSSSIGGAFMVLSAVIVVVSMAGAYISYAKRDMFI